MIISTRRNFYAEQFYKNINPQLVGNKIFGFSLVTTHILQAVTAIKSNFTSSAWHSYI